MKINQKKYESFGIWYDHKGYPCIWINGREIKLHIYVWEKENGNKPKGYELHHKDFNKSNYSLGNLELMSLSDHRRLHAGWIKEKGIWAKKPCNECTKILPLKEFYYVKTRNIQSALCKKCHNKMIMERNKKPENIIKKRIYNRNYYKEHCGK